MNPHSSLTVETRDRATTYVMGGMSEDEASRYALHLVGCAICLSEVNALKAIVAELASSAPEQAPPAEFKAKVLAAAGSIPTVIRRHATDWTASGVDGVWFRQLMCDAENDRQTILVKMKPGASYPVHTHGGSEECFVVNGSVTDGPLCLNERDYSRYERGTQHGPLLTERGCLLLITTSLHDEIHTGTHDMA